ncbi:MAG: hypothetical protein CM15mP8_3930 [Methanobacteriota archaeon]|nr:MAG: hypothetical protein CM15mP8_3930 [Euryarchaeota archaeon]
MTLAQAGQCNQERYCERMIRLTCVNCTSGSIFAHGEEKVSVTGMSLCLMSSPITVVINKQSDRLSQF